MRIIMLRLFNKNVFARKRKTKSITTGCVTAIESLEPRLVLATQLATAYSNGSLTIIGSGNADFLTVTVTGTNTVMLSSSDGLATFTGAGNGGVAGFLVTGSISISLGDGNDDVTLAGGAGGTLDGGNLAIDLGSGDNFSRTSGILAINGDVSVVGGVGNQSVSFGDAGANTFAANNLRIENGSGDEKLAYLDNTTITGNVTIINSGTEAQLAQLGDLAPNTIGGNLVITQSNSANTGGYIAQLQDTAVGGNVTITNGSSTGALGIALIRISAVTAATTIGGKAMMVNGNNFSNLINLGSLTAPPPIPFSPSFAGNGTFTNGAATDPVEGNRIDVNNVLFTGTGSTISFTNGSGPNNDVNLGVVSTNSFAGQVFAYNNSGNLVAGTNDIRVPQGVFSRNLNLSNGINAAVGVDVDNTITLANAAAPSTGVDVTGNVVITNANTSTGGNNLMNIGTATIAAGNGLRIAQLTPANGSGSGNLTISNGTTSNGIARVSILGAAANGTAAGSTHAFDGNLSVINRGSTAGGTKQIDLSGLTTFGRTGATLNNAGAGNSTVNIGGGTVVTTAAVFFAQSGGLYVQDGSGTSELNLQLATIGTAGTPDQAGFRYSDFGGGSDAINISTLAASAVTVNGVTRFDTGAGTDIVTITQSAGLGGGGSAAFNDSVFIALGSGDDTLNIGAFAACPAFSSANRFQFDGTQGVNTIAADPLSVADYTVGRTHFKTPFCPLNPD